MPINGHIFWPDNSKANPIAVNCERPDAHILAHDNLLTNLATQNKHLAPLIEWHLIPSARQVAHAAPMAYRLVFHKRLSQD
jgi:hypothetical protein